MNSSSLVADTFAPSDQVGHVAAAMSRQWNWGRLTSCPRLQSLLSRFLRESERFHGLEVVLLTRAIQAYIRGFLFLARRVLRDRVDNERMRWRLGKVLVGKVGSDF